MPYDYPTDVICAYCGFKEFVPRNELSQWECPQCALGENLYEIPKTQ